MKVWLDPVGHNVPSVMPDQELCYMSILIRIEQACVKAGLQSLELSQLISDAARIPHKRKHWDAAEKIDGERLAVGFSRRLRETLTGINLNFDTTIEWCLPFIDFDINFKTQIEIIRQLKKFPSLSIYVAVADVDNPVCNCVQNQANVTIVADHTLEIMSPELGFPSHMTKKPVTIDTFDYEDDISHLSEFEEYFSEEDEEVKVTKKKPKYRNIDED